MILVPDTSVIIDGRVTALINNGEYRGATIIIPEAVFAELESQANRGREIGFSGLIELQKLHQLKHDGIINLECVGHRPKLEQVQLAGGGEIDSMIRDVAIQYNATFLTSDYIQAEVARAKGINVVFLKSEEFNNFSPLSIDEYFDENTLAVYLKERVIPYARKGSIRESEIVPIGNIPLSENKLRTIAQECIERAKRHPDGFIEIEKPGVTIALIGSMRITITRPPFSDGFEITIIRQICNVDIDSYNYISLLKERLRMENGGMLIIGNPGSGVSTLEQNIAIYLSTKHKIVKTIESTRDLLVPDVITQYSPIDGKISSTCDILSLLRPDYIIFNEMNKTSEINVFSDMRLSGINVIGGLHARSITEAIIRLLNLINFNLLPQVIETVVCVKDGNITDICNVSMVFDKPTSLENQSDLHIRPIIRVTNLITGEVMVESFKYYGEIVVSQGKSLYKHKEPVNTQVNAEDIKKEEVEDTNYQSDLSMLYNIPISTDNVVTESNDEQTDSSVDLEHNNSDFENIEKDIQNEISRYTDGEVIVQMISNNKFAVYIDDIDVPAAIGKSGKNISSIVNKLGVGIDLRPNSDLDNNKQQVMIDNDTVMQEASLQHQTISDPVYKIKIDNKYISIACPQYRNKIVDVFSDANYLFTATVDSHGDIYLSRTSSIASEFYKHYYAGGKLKIRSMD
ncbi:MAG TPA: ATPase, T2SS/T4P/T4SS family [Methanocorpusculum sp.]|nr:ATPase, T2SS/T4P/T4SS family [Methanocorpusculum sp.]